MPKMTGESQIPPSGLVCPFEKLRPSQLIRDDAFFMSLAFNLAVDAWRIDEVPIGAIIERGGEIKRPKKSGTGDLMTALFM